jgi:acetyltransferase-like isoleucine patch superfamily enzyme
MTLGPDLIRRKILNQVAKFQRLWRVERARFSGIAIGRDALFGPHLEFQLGIRDGRQGRISVGDNAWIEHGASFCAFGGSIDIGPSVFVGPNVVIYGQGGVTIGEESLISMHCCILSSEHTVPGPGQIIRQQPDILLATRIGRDVWLGAGVKVLGGVTIGDGCVVGAGAVVTADLASYSIAVGVPAKVIGLRS